MSMTIEVKIDSQRSDSVYKVLLIQSPDPLKAIFDPQVEFQDVESLQLAMTELAEHQGQTLCCPPDIGQSLLEMASVFDLLPTGIALLDADNRIIRANQQLISWFPTEQLTGKNFYSALGNPCILGPELSPLSSVAAKKVSCFSLIQVDDRHFRMHASPILNRRGICSHRIVSLIEITESVQERQKLEALHQAGVALADLRPEEISEMDFGQRIDLLKENILHYTKDLLNFDVVEIRLLKDDKRLEPLLSVGINAEQSKNPLYARETGNGVTGFVAATGKSYLCEDTTKDPLYVKGLIGARSSLTVPLIYHHDVIGTFNVESPQINAFTDSGLKFLESFARDVAVALNTLDLLSAQQTNATMQSVEAIHSRVVLPIDEILNDTVLAIDAYQGSDQAVIRRLQTILRNAREIKQVIHRVGEQLAGSNRAAATQFQEERPKLRDKRVLVIDAEDEIRTSAHSLLERYGCVVETAHSGREALSMIRNSGLSNAYDAIIADIRLPDIKGYELLIQLKSFLEDPPLILMTGYGYDPGHSIVKARQAGLKAHATVFKPFRLKQLLDTLDTTVNEPVVS
jgi:two-component system, sensor histidine kinase SagS